MASLEFERSSMARSAEYDYESETLDVTLVSGTTYRYSDFPSGAWRALRKVAQSRDGSAGRYLSRNVVLGGYPVKKLRG